MLMSAFDGLSLDLLAGNRTRPEALSAVAYRLDQVFNRKAVVAVLPDPSAVGPHETDPAR